MKLQWVLVSLLFFSEAGFAISTLPDLGKQFKSNTGCFVIKKIGSDQVQTYNEKQCRKRLKPCSTFKILNSLIGLETRAVKDKNTVFQWDGTKQPYKSWERDHTLASAIKYSVVPYYQQLARTVGIERMKTHVARAKYGNQDIGKVVDRFWLDGPLMITAFEQIDFLERLYLGKLPFSKKHQNIVREIVVQNQSNSRTFSGKTGSSFKDGAFHLGWFVGYIKHGNGEYVFAANSEGLGAKGSEVKTIVEDTLKEMGL